MPAHIFVLGESNLWVCIQRGLVGLPEGRADSKNEKAVNDTLLSRAAIIKDGDYVLFYIVGSKKLRGIWKASGEPFYDGMPVWEDKTYPFRFRLNSTEFSFDNPLRLHDIYDLRCTQREQDVPILKQLNPVHRERPRSTTPEMYSAAF